MSSEDLIGKPTLLVFLAGHCSHSFQTLPILQELQKQHAADGLQVVGVYINSGSPEDVNDLIEYFEPEYSVWAYADADLGDVIDSHLVPTYLLVDAQGQLKQKLVGYKSQQEVAQSLAAQLAIGNEIEVGMLGGTGR